MLPRDSDPGRRTSEPSGAMASGVAAMFLVSRVIDTAQVIDRRSLPIDALLIGSIERWSPLFLLFLQEIISDPNVLSRRNPRH
jgi:hypothetical protein